MRKDVIGFEALYNSMCKCRKGVMWKSSVASFCLNGLENTIKLEEKLQAETYKPSKPYNFIITSPKRREIMSVCFKDRVFQRSLNDVAVYPEIIKSFIRDNLACQKGKGTDLARARLKIFLHKMFRKYGNNFYVLQCDIHGYYPNMRHSIAKAKFRKELDQWTYNECAKILDGQYQTDIGFNPGSQMIQIAGISVLDEMDHYIKEKLHIKFYLRYMDDFLLFHQDKDYLESCKKQIETRLKLIGFEFNPKKTKIINIISGLTFLGFNFKLSTTGKLIMILDPKSVKRERKKLCRMATLVKQGKISKKKVYECYNSWKNHASKGNSFKLLLRMDKYLKNLWGVILWNRK